MPAGCRDVRRWLSIVPLLAVVATACGPGGSGSPGEGAGRTLRFEQPAPSPREDVPSALDNADDERLPAPLVDTAEIISGGPPPGSRWDIFGTATSGSLEGKRLEPLTHVDTFWFAWAAYLPDSSNRSVMVVAGPRS